MPTPYATDEMGPPASVLRCCGASRGRCGYCKGTDSSLSFGMWAVRLAARDYQALIDSGWRRSGHYLYRPDNARTCCPLYTIRLPVDRFRPGKGHNRVLKRLRRHTVTQHAGMAGAAGPGNDDRGQAAGEGDRKNGAAGNTAEGSGADERRREATLECVRRALGGIAAGVPKEAVDAATGQVRVDVWQEPKGKKDGKKKKRKLNPVVQGEPVSPAEVKKGNPHFATNAAFVLASMERNHLSVARPAQFAKDANGKKKGRTRLNCEPRQMEIGRIVLEQLNAVCANEDALLERVELVSPGFINLWVREECIPDAGGVQPAETKPPEAASSPSSGADADRGGEPDAGSSPSDGADADLGGQDANPSTASAQAPFTNGPFTQEFVPAQFDRESFTIFRRYQVAVHNDAPDEWSERAYRSFLVDTPLRPEPAAPAAGSTDAGIPYGSYHVRYRLNGRLFAVGVVDVLPSCLSSVYLFYDPAFASLSPGVLSALQEIAWVSAESARKPGMKYYYMGYYIHSCAKMRYKAAFVPSEMRCPDTRVWVPTKDACVAIDAGGSPTRLAPAGMQAAEDIEDYSLSHAAASKEALSASVLVPGGEQTRFAELRGRLPPSAGRVLDGIQECIGAFVRRAGRAQSRAFVFDLASA